MLLHCQHPRARGREWELLLRARDPLFLPLQRLGCVKASDAVLPGREKRRHRVTGKPFPWARGAQGARLCRPGLPSERRLAGRGRLAVEPGAPSGGAGSSRPPAPPGCSPRPGRVSSAAQTPRNPRGRLTALFAVGPRTCKLSPAHMLHIKPPCPVPFLFFSSERVLINFPSFM